MDFFAAGRRAADFLEADFFFAEVLGEDFAPFAAFFVAARFAAGRFAAAFDAFFVADLGADLTAGFAACTGVAACRANPAPCGSPRIAMRPPGMSIGPRWSVAPAFLAMSTALSTSFTKKYTIQNGGIPAMSGMRLNMPPNIFPLPNME